MPLQHGEKRPRQSKGAPGCFGLGSADNGSAPRAPGDLLKDTDGVLVEVDPAHTETGTLAPTKTQHCSEIDHRPVPRPEGFAESGKMLRREDWPIYWIYGWESDTSAWRSTDSVVKDRSVQDGGEGLVDPSDRSRGKRLGPLIYASLDVRRSQRSDWAITDRREDVHPERRLITSTGGWAFGRVRVEPVSGSVPQPLLSTTGIEPSPTRPTCPLGGFEQVGFAPRPESLRVDPAGKITQPNVIAPLAAAGQSNTDQADSRGAADPESRLDSWPTKSRRASVGIRRLTPILTDRSSPVPISS